MASLPLCKFSRAILDGCGGGREAMSIVGCTLGMICAQFMGTTRVSVMVACCLCWYQCVGFGSLGGMATFVFQCIDLLYCVFAR